MNLLQTKGQDMHAPKNAILEGEWDMDAAKVFLFKWVNPKP
jgi:hypothetical protein